MAVCGLRAQLGTSRHHWTVVLAYSSHSVSPPSIVTNANPRVLVEEVFRQHGPTPAIRRRRHANRLCHSDSTEGQKPRMSDCATRTTNSSWCAVRLVRRARSLFPSILRTCPLTVASKNLAKRPKNSVPVPPVLVWSVRCTRRARPCP